MHTFFEKPTRSEKSLDAKSAFAESAMQSSLYRFAVKLYNSSHSPNRIKLIFVEALLKFKEMKHLDQLDPLDPMY